MLHKRPTRDVLPICLLTGGRRCVVIGGGMIAARKVRALLDAGATVHVVSPDLCADLAACAAMHAITHTARACVPADVAGAFLVVAATNDRTVNRMVARWCRTHHVLCSLVDAHWTEGDFVSPATLREKDLVIAVSTGGRSCRRARLLKDRFKRHLATLDAAELIIIGTSHHQLPVDRREPYHLVGHRMQQTGDMLRQLWGVHELVLLNTCNRIEALALAAPDPTIPRVMAHVLGFDHLAADEYYVKHGFDAFSHGALVTAGLLSQMPGEHHIVAQVKDAVATAGAARWSGGFMKDWLAATLTAARDIRAVTQPLLREREIEDLAFEYLRAAHPRLAGMHVLVVGTGAIGTGMVRRCLAARMTCDWCYHSKRPVLEPAWKSRVTLSTLADMATHIHAADIIVCATAHPGYVLHKPHVKLFDKNKDALVVDLAMPRTVAPDLATVSPRVRVADLEDLKRWHRREALDMDRIMKHAARALARHRLPYEQLVDAFKTGSAPL